MKVFVVNLKHEYKRRESIEKQLRSMGADYCIVPAVNGKDLPEEEIQRTCDTVAIAKHPTWLSRGAIGCSLSHLSIYQKIVDENIQTAVILEDDVQLEKSFLASIDQIEKVIEPDEVIMLYYQSWQPLELLKNSELNLGSAILYKPNHIAQLITTGGYIVTYDVAKEFLNKGFPIDVSADSWGVFHERGIVAKMRCVHPRPVNVLPFKSSIEYIQSPMMSKISKIVNELEVPILYPMLKNQRKKRLKKVQAVKFI